MTLVRWEPFREINTLRRQMDRLFEDMGSLTGWERPERLTYAPAIELKETDEAMILKAQVPGIEAKDLDVEVTRDSVILSGEHRQEERTEEKGYYRSEFRYGSFRRVVPLPTEVKTDKVKAEFKDGVLMLTLPKIEEEVRKAVKIRLEGQA